jgi:DNA repair exonuclease SbcCD ATPase subunit
MEQSQGGQAVSNMVNVHAEYWKTINDLSRDKKELLDRIKRLEQELMEVKNKHAVLVADVALYEDRAERINQLEDRIHRASMAFFRDGSDGHIASQMLQILEEERGKK